MRIFIMISILISLVSLTMGSCVTTSKINYFQQNLLNDTLINSIKYYGPSFQVGDIIDVRVLTNSKDVVELYPNLTTSQILTNQTYVSGNPVQSGYTVDSNGCIIVPGIGKLNVLNKTKNTLQEEIVDSLKSHILDPVVNIKLLNFKISILGDVKLPGIYQIPNDRITLFEAIALAGDLNYSGNRKTVKLIRTEKGIRKEFIIDLTQSDHYGKEYFYLKQNDLLYIPTTSVRLNQLNYAQYYLPAISSLSLIITFLNLIKQ